MESAIKNNLEDLDCTFDWQGHPFRTLYSCDNSSRDYIDIMSKHSATACLFDPMPETNHLHCSVEDNNKMLFHQAGMNDSNFKYRIETKYDKSKRRLVECFDRLSLETHRRVATH